MSHCSLLSTKRSPVAKPLKNRRVIEPVLLATNNTSSARFGDENIARVPSRKHPRCLKFSSLPQSSVTQEGGKNFKTSDFLMEHTPCSHQLGSQTPKVAFVFWFDETSLKRWLSRQKEKKSGKITEEYYY
ncbi:hypothetical protein CEXT_177141 [Caerostris extrusa]|uniref:Uncharacterized protein n=1 Tax=Caerostris extrusa TaxID=172846 RepID=A0AAV4WZR1_CAEEX|nr:hypothetical protein CEXT_177141 [Caerostris extrusa]